MSETVFLENLGRLSRSLCAVRLLLKQTFLGLAQVLCSLLENPFCLELLPVVDNLLARESRLEQCAVNIAVGAVGLNVNHIVANGKLFFADWETFQCFSNNAQDLRSKAERW
jgi:hypothetical protein